MKGTYCTFTAMAYGSLKLLFVLHCFECFADETAVTQGMLLTLMAFIQKLLVKKLDLSSQDIYLIRRRTS